MLDSDGCVKERCYLASNEGCILYTMAIDLKKLRKLESLPASEFVRSRQEDERLVVLVKLRAGSARPEYVAPRGRISDRIFSVEIRAGELRRLEADPAVESVSMSRVAPVVP